MVRFDIHCVLTPDPAWVGPIAEEPHKALHTYLAFLIIALL